MQAVDIAVASSEVCQFLLQYLSELETHQRIAAYYAMNGEIIPNPALVSLRSGGHLISLPYVSDNDEMLFYECKKDDELQQDSLGILSPEKTAKEIIADIILMPLVAFDRSGGRIGHGGGYYDRKLSTLHNAGHYPKLIGLAYSWQETQPNIPLEPHDVRLDIVVTDKEVVNII